MDPRGGFLENYRCVDGCQKLNTYTKVVYAPQLSDALIIQLWIFKYIDKISKKFISNEKIDEEITLQKYSVTFRCCLSWRITVL